MYVIVKSGNRVGLMQKVNEHLSRGYGLVGGPFKSGANWCQGLQLMVSETNE